LYDIVNTLLSYRDLSLTEQHQSMALCLSQVLDEQCEGPPKSKAVGMQFEAACRLFSLQKLILQFTQLIKQLNILFSQLVDNLR